MDRIKSWDEYFMRLAYLIANKSFDPKTRIGSVLVRDKHVISTGYNSFPRKILDSLERYNDRELKRKITCHSEENTITISARLGINTCDSILYTFGIPCVSCSKILLQGGVKEIVVHSQWPNLTHSPEWVSSIELSKVLLTEAGINVRRFDMILGLKGFLDGREIDV
jgi:dCMP deaminase